MLFNRKSVKTSKRHHAWLYSCVFSGRLATLAVFVLFASFLLQPFHQAFAYDDAVSSEDTSVVVAEDVVPQEPTPVSPPEIVEEEPLAEPLSPEATAEVLPQDLPLEEILDNDTPVDESVEESQESPSSVIEDEPPEDEELTEAVDEVSEGIPEDTLIGTSTDGAITATSLITDENYFQFSKQACVAVGAGVYHCATKVADTIDSNAVVYSELSDKGNLEIYIKTVTGRVKQLTDNEFDDSAPHYDAESRQVVWQRVIDGRYQIVVFSIDDEVETQLTFSKTNNMEPKISAAGVVWQAWDGNDWEVMYFDGSFTEQLTNNDSQDVAPVIQDGYVLWSVLGQSEQQARVYSLDSKVTTSIVGHEGGTVVNPRFVLVYDTKFENGDVITQGFDPATGLSAPITATPAEAPVSIPESDPLGEIRALIQNKSSQKDEFDTPDIDGEPDTPTVASSTPGTLDLKTVTSDGGPDVASSATTTANAIELTEYDIVITDFSSAE